MASRTIDDIISEGCLKAGDEGVASRMYGYFNDWLQRQARSWPWPSLTYPLSLTVEAGDYAVLSDAGGIDLPVSRVLDECWLYTTDRKQRSRLRIRKVGAEPLIEPPADAVGKPSAVWIRPTTDGIWGFFFDTHLDRDYLFVTSACIVPERLSQGATELPWYPEDDTCIQAVMYEVLLYKNGPEDPSTQAALEVLASMVQADRVRHGSSPGQNDEWGLDKGMYR